MWVALVAMTVLSAEPAVTPFTATWAVTPLTATGAVTPLTATGAVLRLRAVGDVMLGTSEPKGYLPPDDGAQMLAGVKDWLADADLTFMNFEGPLCDDGASSKCKKKGNCFAFRTPTRYVKYVVEAGVDLGSTANNHSGDFGELCRRQTEATLDKAGIAWSGPPGSIARVEKNGLKVAMVAFHTSAACNDVNDLAGARALVKKAAEGADLVLVSFHGGGEGTKADRVLPGPEKYLGENRGDLRAFARAVVDAGADVVIGHGPHVLRGLELYKGRLVAYSLGNFATYGRFDLSGPLAVGAVLEVEVAKDGAFVQGRIFSTVQVDKGVPQKDAKERARAALKALTARDFPKAGLEFRDDGRLLPAVVTN
jgi:poly-gamma-glutamate capsule biosynthesis protein CapA/YwtB (metallophosphatase superfamily)